MAEPINWPKLPKHMARKSHAERKAERIAKRFPRVTPAMIEQSEKTAETIDDVKARITAIRARLDA